MCKVVEDYANDEKIDMLKGLFANGVSLETALKSVANLPKETIIKVYEEVIVEINNL